MASAEEERLVRALAPHLDETTQPGKRPVERAPEARPLLSFVAERSAAEEIGAMQQPDPRLLQGAGDAVDLGGIGGPCPPHPGPYDGVGEPGQQSAQRQPAEAGVANRQRLGFPLSQVTAGRAIQRINPSLFEELVAAGTVTADRVSGLKIGYRKGNKLAGLYDRGDWLVRFDTLGPALEAGLPEDMREMVRASRRPSEVAEAVREALKKEADEPLDGEQVPHYSVFKDKDEYKDLVDRVKEATTLNLSAFCTKLFSMVKTPRKNKKADAAAAGGSLLLRALPRRRLALRRRRPR